MDTWLMDDQTVACDPRFVCPILGAADQECTDPTRGGEWNRVKTHAIIYANLQQTAEHSHTRDIPGIQHRATLNTPTDELRTLCVTLGGKGNRCKTCKAKLKSYACHAPETRNFERPSGGTQIRQTVPRRKQSATFDVTVRHRPTGHPRTCRSNN